MNLSNIEHVQLDLYGSCIQYHNDPFPKKKLDRNSISGLVMPLKKLAFNMTRKPTNVDRLQHVKEMH